MICIKVKLTRALGEPVGLELVDYSYEAMLLIIRKRGDCSVSLQPMRLGDDACQAAIPGTLVQSMSCIETVIIAPGIIDSEGYRHNHRQACNSKPHD